MCSAHGDLTHVPPPAAEEVITLQQFLELNTVVISSDARVYVLQTLELTTPIGRRTAHLLALALLERSERHHVGTSSAEDALLIVNSIRNDRP